MPEKRQKKEPALRWGVLRYVSTTESPFFDEHFQVVPEDGGGHAELLLAAAGGGGEPEHDGTESYDGFLSKSASATGTLKARLISQVKIVRTLHIFVLTSWTFSTISNHTCDEVPSKPSKKTPSNQLAFMLIDACMYAQDA